MRHPLDNRIPPPLVTLVIAGLMTLVRLDPAPVVLPQPYRWASAGLCLVAAFCFGLPAIRAFVRAKTTINPIAVDRASSLVTGGVFGVTRNPMYVAMAFLLCAVGFGLGNPWGAAGPVAFVLFTTRFQIMPEEAALTALFGPSYLEYQRRVRRGL